ncbi:hypothetical protein [Psychrobacter ciconiae]|uniref:hypothetical protein n=1 Tax=Psychrobacter ciconiae TaxID=1553449 RepID=UPI001918C8E5|nr:hypothetical protein [Psychrobacter ciconiae]
MPYLFGGLVVLNAIVLSYYLFLKPPERSKSVQQAHAALTQPIEFSNSAAYIPPPIGTKK